MATTDDDDQLYPEFVEDFEENWHPFRGLLPPAEQENWDVLIERAKQRSYAGHAQLASAESMKWPLVFTMLVSQQAEIGQLREQLHDFQSQQAEQ
ncbi:hypothetical protein [Halobacterium sp. R2-5]|uniref:hypothetical protein n=1 Tax=Halobacterium sp. R2-5 TaxID=2715751 RepID=UPI00141E3ED8|nr:hypothetical protein [Halobacterium sp. R2-5]NIC00998.1 hypothetical protein [Halobacterium sp. R2-5]